MNTQNFDFATEYNHRKFRKVLQPHVLGQLQAYFAKGVQRFRMVAGSEVEARRMQSRGRGSKPLLLETSKSAFNWQTNLADDFLRVVIPDRNHVHSLVRGYTKGNKNQSDYLSTGELIVWPSARMGNVDPFSGVSDDKRESGAVIGKQTEETRNEIFFRFPPKAGESKEESEKLYIFTDRSFKLGKLLRSEEFLSKLDNGPVTAEIRLTGSAVEINILP